MSSVAVRSGVREAATWPTWRWLLVGIVAVAVALRFGLLLQQSVWYDEVLTHDLVVRSFGDMLSGVANTENTPPLSYVLTWVSTRILGDGELGLRFVAAAAGAATVPVAFLLGRALRSTQAGLWAAALVAVNPMLWWFSHESRSYALLVLLTAVGLLCFVNALRPDVNSQGLFLIGWAVASALALTTHYFAIVPIAAEAGWLLWTRRSELRPRVWLPVGAVLLAAIAITPMALDQERSGRADVIANEPLGQRVAQVPKQFLTGYDGPAQAALTAFAALALVIAALGLWRHLRSGGAGLSVVVVAAAAVGVPLAAAVVGVDYLNTRNLIAALVPVLVLAGVGFASAPPRLGTAAAALLVVTGLVTVVGVAVNPRYQRSAWRSLDGAIGDSREPRLLVMSPGEAPTPLGFYREGLSPVAEQGMGVREVLVAGLAAKSSAGGTAEAPSAAGQPPPAPGFRLVDRRSTSTYTVLRYRSRTPVVVTPQALSESRLDDSYTMLGVPASR